MHYYWGSLLGAPMPRGRPRKFALELSDTERAQLAALANSRALAHGLVRRAHIILRSVAVALNTGLPTLARALLRRKSAPHRRALSQSARQGAGPLRRREEPDPSA